MAAGLAQEGGLPSALWAGTRSRGPVQLRFHVIDEDFEYELACGLPIQGPGSTSQFKLDPQVKEESLSIIGEAGKPVVMLHRNGRAVQVRDRDGRMVVYPLSLTDNESALCQIRDPQRYPELSVLRDRLQRWRFYHHFRTDMLSPLRQPQVGVVTPVLGHDGSDLAAALQTIIEFGDHSCLHQAIAEAFPATELRIAKDEGGRFRIQMRPQGILRWLDASELSDGTLRFLCLAAALLSSRPPALLALNEPEASLHPDLIAPLGRLMVAASRLAQVWITTHSRELAKVITAHSGEAAIELNIVDGQTQVVNSLSST